MEAGRIPDFKMIQNAGIPSPVPSVTALRAVEPHGSGKDSRFQNDSKCRDSFTRSQPDRPESGQAAGSRKDSKFKMPDSKGAASVRLISSNILQVVHLRPGPLIKRA